MIFNKVQAVLVVILYINFLPLKMVKSCGIYKECDELCCDVQACKETNHNLITTQNLCTCKNKSEMLTTFGGAAKCVPVLEPGKMTSLFYLSDMDCLPNSKCDSKCCEDHQKCKENQCVEVKAKDIAQVFYIMDKECSSGKPKCSGICCEDHQKCKENQCVEVKAKDLAQVFYIRDKECSSGKPKCSEICCEDHQQCKENQCVEVKAEDLSKLYYYSDIGCSLEKPKCNGTCCEDHQECKENQCVEVKAEELAKSYYFNDIVCSLKKPKCNGICCEDHQECKENQCVDVKAEDLAKLHYFSDKECFSEKLKCNATCCEDHQECKEEQCVDVKAEDLAKLYNFSDKHYSLQPLKCNGIYCREHQKCQDKHCVEVRAEDVAKLYFFMDKIYSSVTLNCNGAQCADNEICKDNHCKANQEETFTTEICKNKCDKFCCQEQSSCGDVKSNPTLAINNCTCLDATKVLALINGVVDCRPKVEPLELIPIFYFNDLCCDIENPNCDTSYCDLSDSPTTPSLQEILKENEPPKCLSENLNCNGLCCDVHQECKNNLCINVEEEIVSETKCLTNHTVCSNICCAPNVACHNSKCICQRGYTERFNQFHNIQYCEPVIVSKTPYLVLGIGCILFALSFLIFKVYGFCRSSSYVF